MTRRARGPGALARRLSALGGSCLVASWFWLVSCDSRFEFESLTEAEGGADSGGRTGSYGGYGFGEGYGYGGFGFGTGGAMGNARGGMGNDPNDECVVKCSAAGLKCHPTSKLCVECLEHSDCTGGLNRCSTDPDWRNLTNRCVQCLDNDDCGNQVCAPFTHTCVTPCDRENQDQCSVLAATIGCSTLSGYCAGCFTEDDCKSNDSLSHCLGKVRCGQCAEDRDCPDDKWCDPVRFVCVQCRTSKDCKDGQLCNRQTHLCQVEPI